MRHVFRRKKGEEGNIEERKEGMEEWGREERKGERKGRIEGRRLKEGRKEGKRMSFHSNSYHIFDTYKILFCGLHMFTLFLCISVLLVMQSILKMKSLNTRVYITLSKTLTKSKAHDYIKHISLPTHPNFKSFFVV